MAVLLGFLFALLALMARRGVARGVWDAITAHRLLMGLLVIVLLFLVGLVVTLQDISKAESFRLREERDLTSKSNLVANPLSAADSIPRTVPASWTISGTLTLYPADQQARASVAMGPHSSMTYNIIAVR